MGLGSNSVLLALSAGGFLVPSWPTPLRVGFRNQLGPNGQPVASFLSCLTEPLNVS